MNKEKLQLTTIDTHRLIVGEKGFVFFQVMYPFGAKIEAKVISSYNACLNFDNPQQDIQRIIEALKWVKNHTTDELSRNEAMNVLALYREVK